MGTLDHLPVRGDEIIGTGTLAASRHAAGIGLAVHAGHGLTYLNVAPVAAVQSIEELNIGHSVMSRAILTGMQEAVSEMRRLVPR